MSNSYQFPAPAIPSYWSGEERRYAKQLEDVLLSIYAWRGRLTDKDFTENAKTNIVHKVEENIDIAKVREFSANIVRVVSGYFDSATIDWAQMQNLYAAVAEIADAKVDNISIDTAHIADGAITAAKIANSAVTNEKVVSLSASKLTAGRIDAQDIEVVNLSADNITVGTLNGERLMDGAVTTEKLSEAFLEHVESIRDTGIRNSAMILNNGETLTALVDSVNEQQSENIKRMTTIEQAADALSVTVGTYQQDLNDTIKPVVQNVEQNFRFTEDGLTIQKTGSAFATELSDTALSFKENGSTVASISGSALNIEKGKIVQELQVGGFAFITTEYGMGVVWRGNE